MWLSRPEEIFCVVVTLVGSIQVGRTGVEKGLGGPAGGKSLIMYLYCSRLVGQGWRQGWAVVGENIWRTPRKTGTERLPGSPVQAASVMGEDPH